MMTFFKRKTEAEMQTQLRDIQAKRETAQRRDKLKMQIQQERSALGQARMAGFKRTMHKVATNVGTTATKIVEAQERNEKRLKQKQKGYSIGKTRLM